MFRAPAESKPWYRRGPGVAAGLAAVLVALLFIIQPWKTGDAITAIAVLPFENISGDEDQEYYADGMTGQLISKLGGLRIFDRVISRRSVMQYKGESMSLVKIGSDLGVQAVVEGSVMLLDDRVQVTAFLLDAARDRQLWTDTFDEPVANIMDIQKRIVTAIARAVRQELDPAAQERLREMGTVNPDAHKACMRGYEWLDKQGTYEELELAAQYFEEAIAADSTYALAYAGLGESLTQLTHTFEVPSPEHLERTRTVIDRALELDGELAEAHATQAHFLWEHQFEFEEAEKAFLKAMELNPSLALNHAIYSYYLGTVLRFDEAAAAARKAIELDPSSLWMHSVLIHPLILAEQYEEAFDQIEATRKKYPGWEGKDWIWTIYAVQGKWSEAHALIDSVDQKDWGPFDVQKQIRALVHLGRKDEARAMFDSHRAAAKKDSLYFTLAARSAILGEEEMARDFIQKFESTGSPQLIPRALLYAMIKDNDKAIDILNDAFEKKINWVTRLGWYVKEEGWSSLDGDPRFEELLKKIGIPI
jgi:TolB-like protein